MHLRDNSDVGKEGILWQETKESTCYSDSVGWCGMSYSELPDILSVTVAGITKETEPTINMLSIALKGGHYGWNFAAPWRNMPHKPL